MPGLIPIMIGTPTPVGEHTVRYFDYDGTLLKTENLNDGRTLTPPSSVPENPYLIFNKWSRDIAEIILNGYLRNVPTPELRDIPVVFKINGEVVIAEIQGGEPITGTFINSIIDIEENLPGYGIVKIDGPLIGSSFLGTWDIAGAITGVVDAEVIDQGVYQDLDIGAFYNTVDDSSYLFVSISATTGYEPIMVLKKENTSLLTIDWGDGTTTTTSNNGDVVLTKPSPYVDGDYIITIISSYYYSIGGISTAFASYIGIPTGCATSITITADNVGTDGNNIKFAGDGSKTVSQLLADWNAANPSNTATLTLGDGSQVPGNKVNYKLTNGASGATSVFKNDKTVSKCLTKAHLSKYIGLNQYAFSDCVNLETISLPSLVIKSESYIFRGCRNLKAIIFPSIYSSTKLIKASSFYECISLNTVVISDGITELEASCFTGTSMDTGCYSLESIILPNTITDIGVSCFEFARNLKSVILPNMIATIPLKTFNSNYALESIEIPSSVTNLYGFGSCHNLRNVYMLPTTPPTITVDTFLSLNPLCKIWVPADSYDDYIIAEYWSDLESQIYSTP